jgi:transcriptional regulator with XRE-family HTH domain
VSPSPSPVVANWELVLRLRERREQLDISVKDLTERLGFTRNYWSAIENERKIIPENTLKNLFEILEFGDDDRQQLLRLREEAKENGWWNKYSALFDNSNQRLFGLEQGARKICTYDTLLMPVLLQTPDYARAVLRTDISVPRVEVEQRVEARMRRQEIIHGDPPLQLTAIMSEAVLRQQVGGGAVLREQLGHLLAMTERHPDTIEIILIPFSAAAVSLLGAGTLSLLDFPSPRLPSVVWHESVTYGGVITDSNKVRDIVTAFREARQHALDLRETMKTIEKYRMDTR